jgi:hypothetical protein
MNSLNTFKVRLKEIEHLKEMAASLGPPMTEQNREKVSVLNRASIVMLCSHLEGYFEDVILEFVDKLCKSNICMGRIPGKLKVAHIKKDLAIHNNREDLVKKLFTNYSKLWDDAQTIKSGYLDGERITSDFANPYPKKVENLFKNIDLRIWKNIPYKLKSDLDAIVSRRCDIAHGNLNSTVSSEDAKRYYCSALDLIGRIDRKIERYLNEIIN